MSFHLQKPQQPSEEGAPRFRIGALLYFQDEAGRLLLMQRSRRPNQGLWCAVGGKLETALGESPYECARREAREETGIALEARELALRAILAEKDYEDCGHWLMFVFLVRKPISELPARMAEGRFAFFGRDELERTPMPPLDRRILLERLLGDEGDSLHVLRTDGEANRHPERLVEEERIRPRR